MPFPEILKENFLKVELKKHSDYIFELVDNTREICIHNKVSLAILISGPSGSGKDSVVNLLPDNFQRIKTCTTRPQRPEEITNDPYIRLSIKEFEESAKRNEFLETNFYDGNYYGSKISEIKKIVSNGKIPILRIDPTGSKNVLRIVKENPKILNGINVLYFFIIPPSKDTLKKRIFKRDVENITDEEKKKEAILKANKRFEGTVLKDLELSKYAHFIVINYEGKLEKVTENIIKTFKSFLN